MISQWRELKCSYCPWYRRKGIHVLFSNKKKLALLLYNLYVGQQQDDIFYYINLIYIHSQNMFFVSIFNGMEYLLKNGPLDLIFFQQIYSQLL